MQRVLVLGGAGVVGSHLVDRLIADGNEVIAIDDLSRGSFANIAHLRRDKRFVFREHDVGVPFRAEVDRIFHLALPSTRAACGIDPVKAAMTCVSGTMNALEVAAANGARLVLGTASERWGAGVRCAESLALDFAGTRHTDVRVVRLPSTYGPRMRAGRRSARDGARASGASRRAARPARSPRPPRSPDVRRRRRGDLGPRDGERAARARGGRAVVGGQRPRARAGRSPRRRGSPSVEVCAPIGGRPALDAVGDGAIARGRAARVDGVRDGRVGRPRRGDRADGALVRGADGPPAGRPSERRLCLRQSSAAPRARPLPPAPRPPATSARAERRGAGRSTSAWLGRSSERFFAERFFAERFFVTVAAVFFFAGDFEVRAAAARGALLVMRPDPARGALRRDASMGCGGFALPRDELGEAARRAGPHAVLVDEREVVVVERVEPLGPRDVLERLFTPESRVIDAQDAWSPPRPVLLTRAGWPPRASTHF